MPSAIHTTAGAFMKRVRAIAFSSTAATKYQSTALSGKTTSASNKGGQRKGCHCTEGKKERQKQRHQHQLLQIDGPLQDRQRAPRIFRQRAFLQLLFRFAQVKGQLAHFNVDRKGKGGHAQQKSQ